MRRVIALAFVVVAFVGTVLVAATATRHQRRVPDFDGDGVPDPTLWRPPTGSGTSGTFYAMMSRTGYTPTSALPASLGVSGDTPIVADYDGDGIADFAVFHPFLTFTWTILLSSQNYTSTATYQWGLDQDVPVPGDYDGDGKTDIAVYRPSDKTWYVLQGGTNFKSAFAVSWGASGATAVPADYDGDGKLDLGFYIPGADVGGTDNWYILQQGTGYRSAFSGRLGNSASVPTPADFDGDGAVDLAVYDPGTASFTIRYWATGYRTGVTKTLGNVGDTPVPADYDGDGKADLAVFRPSIGTYFILTASSGLTTQITREVYGATAASLPVLSR